jgi:hypothetical protein
LCAYRIEDRVGHPALQGPHFIGQRVEGLH